MVGPSAQDIHPQESYVPPAAVGPARCPQQPYQQSGYTQPQPYPPPQGMGAPGDSKKNKAIVSIGNFSLFAIILSLIFFGTFTFLGGFLLGMWLESPTLPTVIVNQDETSLSLAPPSQPQEKVVKTTKNTEQSSKIADLLGDTVGESVSDIQAPDMPDFLTPLVTEAQDAAAKQAASKTQQAVDQGQQVVQPSSHSPSSVQPQAPASPQSSASPQRHGLLATQMLQEVSATSSPSSPSTRPFSQGEGPYSVQLGVYAAKENAEALKNNLQALNYSTYITAGKSSDGNTLYYVHSGSYKNYATAASAASQFTSRNIPGAIVIKISKNGNDAS